MSDDTPQEVEFSYDTMPPPPVPTDDGLRRRRCRSARPGPSFGAACCEEERWRGTVDEVPEFQRRPFIFTWYRLEQPRPRHFWRLHNESVNMWSHVLAAIFMAVRFVQWLSWQDLQACLEWQRGFYSASVMAFYFSSITIFVVSVQSHWTGCAHEERFNYWNCLDRSACLFVVLLGYFAGIPIGYHCMPFLRAVYCWASLVVCCLTSFFMHRAKDDTDKKTLIIIVGACSSLVPAVHWLLISPEGRAAIGSRLIAVIMSGLTGTLLFTQAIPERFANGHFDLFGASHQWWHALIFMTIALYSDCLIVLLDLINAKKFCVA